MTDRRRRQKENRAAKLEAERKQEGRRELFKRIGFALAMGTAVVLLFVVGSLFGGEDGAVPGTYEAYRTQPTACGAEQPPPEQVMSFDTYEQQPDIDVDSTVTATVTTSCGDLVITLDPTISPESVQSFVFLARAGFYDGTVFHRIASDFVVQGGDPEANGTGGPGYSVADEYPTEDYEYVENTVAMANSNRPGTTGSQFFISLSDATSSLTNTYNVLGTLTGGEDVLAAIAAVPTATRPNSTERSVPLESVYIESVEISVG